MLPNWCKAPYVGQRGTAWGYRTPALSALARGSAIMLVVDEAVHPIRRHYTPSDRVQRDGSGVAPLVWSRACISRLCGCV